MTEKCGAPRAGAQACFLLAVLCSAWCASTVDPQQLALTLPPPLNSSYASSGMCLYQDRHLNLLRAGFDSCADCLAGCLHWPECAKVFYDGVNLTRRADLYKYDCVVHAQRPVLGSDGLRAKLLQPQGSNQSLSCPLNVQRDVTWFSLLEQQLPGRFSPRLEGGVLLDGGLRRVLHVCLPLSLHAGAKGRDRRACVGHIGYTWDGASNCYSNAGGHACSVPVDGETLFVLGNPLLHWFGQDAPTEQYVVVHSYSSTAGTTVNVLACRAKYGDGTFVGELVLPTGTPLDALPRAQRTCAINHRGATVTEPRFELLGIRPSGVLGASACCSECGGRVNATFPGSTALGSGSTLLAANAADCCALCRSLPGCMAYVFSTDGSSMCQLKAHVMKKDAGAAVDLGACAAGAAHATTIGGVVSGTTASLEVCAPNAEMLNNKKYYDPLGNSTTMASDGLADCCTKCKRSVQCMTFSYHKVLQICRLHFALTATYSHLDYISARIH